MSRLRKKALYPDDGSVREFQMRILHAIHSTNPKGGGPIEGVRQLAARNMAAGHEIEIVTLDAPNSSWLRDIPIECHAMGPSLLSYGYTPRFVPWLRENHRRYDVVIVNGIWQYNSFGTWRALRDTSTPYCVFTHGMLDPWFKRNYPLKHLKKLLYWPWGDYRVLRDALAVLFTSEEERRLARQSFWLYRCDECVITYGTSGPTGNKAQQLRLFFQAFPELEAKRFLLFLGRIHEKKGCDLLIQAFANSLSQLQNKDGLQLDDLHLVFAGPDDNLFARRLKEMAMRLGVNSKVTWTGMLSGDLKWGSFHCADAFVLPSHQENFGIAVAEALACGVPVLISNKVNIWREIKMHQAGIIESDDLEGTTLMLKKWMRLSPDDRAAMKANAATCFHHCFNIEKVADSFINTLKLFGLTL